MNELTRIRTDVVGSLLRPSALKDAYRRYAAGQIGADELSRIEDEHIRQAIDLQEQAGLDVVTDGEFRRLNFQESFGASVSGYTAGEKDIKGEIGLYEARVAGATPLSRWEIPMEGPGPAVAARRAVTERLRLLENRPLAEYRFVSPVARRPAKVTLIGPDRIIQRFDHERSKVVYPTMDEFVADVVRIEHEMIRDLVAAGCRYIQIDAPGYTAYGDPSSLAAMRSRGEDPQANFARSLRADNDLLRGHVGVTFGVHLCRGNQRSMWHREGSYEAIAERLFTDLGHDRFLLEYDSPRAGGFEPLRFVPEGKVVVLGLVSTKIPQLEPVDTLRRRIEEASRYVPLERLAISPQCGFASDVVGNLLSEDDQKRKLERVVETARLVWGWRE